MDYKKMLKKDLVKEVTKLKKLTDKNVYGHHVDGCNIEVKVWDDKAIVGLNNVTQALLNITNIYKATNVNIGALLQLGGETDGSHITNNMLFGKQEID